MSELTAAQVATLACLMRQIGDCGTTLIGGSALALQYPGVFQRQTNDLDFVVALAVDECQKALSEIPGWKPGRREHEWRSAQGVLVDVLPAGPGLLTAGFVDWPRSGARMSLIGLRHAFTAGVTVNDVRVAPPHVIALLKMVSYLDRPAERGRDLEDLDFLLRRYIDTGSDALLDHAASAQIDEVSTGPALLLGADLRSLLSEEERALVFRWLELAENPDDRHRTHARMIGRRAMDDDLRSIELGTRLAAFRKGLG